MNHKLRNVAIRLVEEPPLISETEILSPSDAVLLVGDNLKQHAKEILCMICMDAKGRPLNMSVVSMGTLTNSIVDPKEVFKTALLCNAASIVILHNHPSGELTPSKADIMVTDQLVKCGKYMALPVHDHIIVGNTKTKGYYSMKENLLIDDSRQAQRVEVATQVSGLRFDIPMVAETVEEPLVIRTKEDVQTYLKQMDSCEVFATNYFDSTIWFRNMAGYECIDDDTAGIIGASREELENYVWNHRKIINSALRGECSYSVEKKDEQPAIRKGRGR